jgi:hypothetical protein
MVLLWNAHNWMRLISVALYIHTLMDNTKALCLWTTCLWSRIWGSSLKMNKQCTYHLPSKICPLGFLSANASNAGWFVMMFTRLLGWCTGRCSKIDPMSCNHIMRHQKISRDKCARDRRDIYKCSWFCARGFTQAISKHDQLEKCIWWWTDVPNLTEKEVSMSKICSQKF